ncbi:hypothetical protein AAHA92_17293 [Salvia divinorum]|uniref:Ribosomal protein S14 n=1 Tax=Salvia divinorum TaxID=28513 RepID=A0ABD1H1S8_SALDI
MALQKVKERKRSKRNSIQETWRRKNKSKNYKSFIDQSLHAHKRKEIREGLRDGLPLHVNTPVMHKPNTNVMQEPNTKNESMIRRSTRPRTDSRMLKEFVWRNHSASATSAGE